MPLKKRSGTDVTFYVVGGKWKRDIISCLHKGIKRPSELQKHLAQVSASARVLRQQLKELETEGQNWLRDLERYMTGTYNGEFDSDFDDSFDTAFELGPLAPSEDEEAPELISNNKDRKIYVLGGR